MNRARFYMGLYRTVFDRPTQNENMYERGYNEGDDKAGNAT
jgi:hypothetical protein